MAVFDQLLAMEQSRHDLEVLRKQVAAPGRGGARTSTIPPGAGERPIEKLKARRSAPPARARAKPCRPRKAKDRGRRYMPGMNLISIEQLENPHFQRWLRGNHGSQPIKPDDEDYDWDTQAESEAERAEQYRLAQARKLKRLWHQWFEE
jgi:hypothetical protein